VYHVKAGYNHDHQKSIPCIDFEGVLSKINTNKQISLADASKQNASKQSYEMYFKM
jgi:hypothetical protein